MSRYDAVLLDAYGTLVELDDPYRRLGDALRRHYGVDAPPPDVERAFRAEMDYYAEHCHRGRDHDSLLALRRECAAIVLDELGIAADPAEAVDDLVEAIRFRVFDDVPPLLAAVRRRGLATAVVSNWDHTLPEVLAEAGLPFDVVVDSASAGTSKPDPRIFAVALERIGVAPARALHVGDTAEADGEGARAAGIDAVVLRRGGPAEPGRVASLAEVVPLLG